MRNLLLNRFVLITCAVLGCGISFARADKMSDAITNKVVSDHARSVGAATSPARRTEVRRASRPEGKRIAAAPAPVARTRVIEHPAHGAVPRPRVAPPIGAPTTAPNR